MSSVHTELVDKFGVITLNREEKRNALSAELISDLVAALDFMKQSNVRAIILRASSKSKTWSAGHDVSELPRNNADPLRWSDPLEEGIRAINRFPTPVIAMVHGTVWGGACDLTFNCDLIVGDPTCAFAITPAKLGVPYNPSGIMHFLMRLPLNVVKEMFFTALPLNADRALQVGILNHLVSEDELEAFTYNLATHICTLSHHSISVIKEQARIIADSFSINTETWEYIQELRRRVYQGRHYHEGIEAFLEKRSPNFV
ncbi:MAG: methylmalonyl-CoA decarboxylase [Chloroflexi bacterium]|uniref:Methylmalonyl-CoA decarboxylase n=1 Tax=Candidatus Chlorohelix allophototropha TaxID=3003348 RepID=A0A8T7M626_9CHLR|nr:methylmalonyl-CoA decarboxylase [Chloroflexota bacterium]WJW69431.1 methylmalonyl-CoA decarboxylase [Chloroflexota bacterium L227-S17]